MLQISLNFREVVECKIEIYIYCHKIIYHFLFVQKDIVTETIINIQLNYTSDKKKPYTNTMRILCLKQLNYFLSDSRAKIKEALLIEVEINHYF